MVVHGSTPRRCAGDDGAVMAEAALLTPLLFFMLFGILEFGGLFRDYLTMQNAATAASRSAAIQGNATDADYQIVQAVKKATNAMPRSYIQRVVVFKATGPSSTVPSTCKSATPRSQNTVSFCNVYGVTADWNGTTPVTDYNCGTPGYSKGWCPSTRKTAIAGVNSPPDYLGIYIEVRHPWITGLFGSAVTISQTSITRLEPQTVT